MGSEKEKIELLIEQNVERQLNGVDWERLGSAISQRIEKESVSKGSRVKFPKAFKMAVGAAAMLVVGVGLWYLVGNSAKTKLEQEQVALLHEQVRELSARADATLNLVERVLEKQEQQQRLNELRAKLASIKDPLEEVQEQVDRTAFILIYQADRMYNELGLKKSAVERYNRLIELFPENRWATVARERLENIQRKKFKKGDLL